MRDADDADMAAEAVPVTPFHQILVLAGLTVLLGVLAGLWWRGCSRAKRCSPSQRLANW
jgi:hypothetical protein